MASSTRRRLATLAVALVLFCTVVLLQTYLSSRVSASTGRVVLVVLSVALGSVVYLLWASAWRPRAPEPAKRPKGGRRRR